MRVWPGFFLFFSGLITFKRNEWTVGRPFALCIHACIFCMGENGREPFIRYDPSLIRDACENIVKMIRVIFIPSTIRFLCHDPINHAIVTSTGKTKVLEMRIVIGQKNPAAGENASFEFLSSSLFLGRKRQRRKKNEE